MIETGARGARSTTSPASCSMSTATRRRACATSPAPSTSRAPACTPTSRPRRTSSGRSSTGPRPRFEAAADRAIDETPRRRSPVERLAALVRAHVERRDRGRRSGRASSSTSGAHLSGGRRAAIAGRRDAYEARFRDDDRRRRRGRRLRARPTRPSPPTFILTALNGIVDLVSPGRPAAARDRIADHYVELALRVRSRRTTDDRPARARSRPAARASAAGPAVQRRGLAHDERFATFEAHVAGGGKVEATDWMPDEYRTAVLRFVEMHANSELMGVLPEREWIMRAPTLRRKLALTAKVQDEVGHAQLLYRVAEDLGKPREAMFDDLLAGKTKFHNVFHYPTSAWADVGIIAWLVDAAAIVAQQALRDSSLRAVRPDDAQDLLGGIGPHHARPRCRGDHGRPARPAQRAAIQEALDRWWGPLMQMHGPRCAAREGPRPPLADQGQDLRGAAPGVPDDLRAADPRARAGDPGPGAAARRGRPGSGATPSPTGTSSGPSSPTTARSPRRGSSSGALNREETRWVRDAILGAPRPRPSRDRPAPADRARRPRPGVLEPWEVFRQEKDGDPMRHGGSVMAPDADARRSTTPARCTAGARRASGCGSSGAPTSSTSTTRTCSSRRSTARSRSRAAT